MLKESSVLLLLTLLVAADAFHDCIQTSRDYRKRKTQRFHAGLYNDDDNDEVCAGGWCVGMLNGPHQGGNASYPVNWNGTAATFVSATMTVPGIPEIVNTKMTFYIWTDVFFGDHGLGRMNQFVPQLILGQALDGSSGPPDFRPQWGYHDSWTFAAHYFFELWNPDTNATEAHAAYGDFYPAHPGEEIWTTFEMTSGADKGNPIWTLSMGVVGDDSRTSTLVVAQPYMGMGAHWKDEPCTSWLEPNYRNMCINACWELYGAKDSSHLPSTGAQYQVDIFQPQLSSSYYPFSSWVQDEGNGHCPSAKIEELRSDASQYVLLDINVDNVESSMFLVDRSKYMQQSTT